jgi:hypothetical protein
MAQTDNSILRAALIGYEMRIAQLRSEMGVIIKKLGTARIVAVAGGSPVRTRRRLSAAARKRIAAAQKKRWAEFHKKKAAAKK